MTSRLARAAPGQPWCPRGAEPSCRLLPLAWHADAVAGPLFPQVLGQPQHANPMAARGAPQPRMAGWPGHYHLISSGPPRDLVSVAGPRLAVGMSMRPKSLQA